MNLDEKVRWKFSYEGDFHPKFENMQQSINDLDDLIASGMFDFEYQTRFFKAFKRLFDGAIKTIKSYLRYQGIFQGAVKDVIKEAFYVGLLENGQAWIDMLFDVTQWAEVNYENLDIKSRIKVKELYLPELENLDKFFKNECEAK